MSTLVNTKETKSYRMKNPVMKHLEKYADSTNTTDTRATYAGIGRKCGIFGLFILLGIALSKLFTSTPIVNTIATQFSQDPGFITFIAVITGFVVMIISSILAGRGKMLTIIFGSLFCTSIGFMLTSIASYNVKYSNHIMLALIITAGIFMAMMVTFTSGLIKVTNKMKSTVFTIFLGMIFTCVLVFISGFIPAMHGLTNFLHNNTLFGIGFSFAFLVIACFYLLFSFDGVKKIVENGVEKDAEWVGAYSIVFSTIWIFIEVLSILSRVDR